jgi:hypothetical protein
MLNKIEKLVKSFNSDMFELNYNKMNEIIDTINQMIDEVEKIKAVSKEKSIEYCGQFSRDK